MIPLLFPLGQHDASLEVQNRLLPGEMLFAYLDDMYVVCRPERVGTVTQSWKTNCGGTPASRSIRKTKIWNRTGTRPDVCDFLERKVRMVDEGARVWRGSLESDAHERGITILGIPLGHPDYVSSAVADDQEASPDFIGHNSTPP